MSVRCQSTSLAALAVGALAVATLSAPPAAAAAKSPISHVVIVVQQDRGFDDLFQGYPGADTSPDGRLCNGRSIPLAPIGLEASYSLSNTAEDAWRAIQDGCFSHERAFGDPIPPHPPYGYVPHGETTRYFAAAGAYVLADRFFSSTVNPAFEALQYLIAAQADDALDNPVGGWGCDAPKGAYVRTFDGKRRRPCFNYRTLADELVGAGLSWRYYVAAPGSPGGQWSAFDAIRHIRYGAAWAGVISPETTFLNDVANGTLANVTWVLPSGANSDAPGYQSASGPAWVTACVDAIGTSSFWKDTVVFVVWDDFGGWSDHLVPPKLDREGLGFRAPLLVVSPYSPAGRVAHTSYEFGSVLKFAEGTFGLAPLAASDSRANPFGKDTFDFSAPPRAFVPI
ncbi:MAG: alkaline phosphatase family protein [Candidatus Baltobacteraceae bacterium]